MVLLVNSAYSVIKKTSKLGCFELNNTQEFGRQNRWMDCFELDDKISQELDDNRIHVLHARKFQWCSQPKIFGDPKIWVEEEFLILGKQQYFVWDTASQSTKWRDILKIGGAWPLATPTASFIGLLPKTISYRAKSLVDQSFSFKAYKMCITDVFTHLVSKLYKNKI